MLKKLLFIVIILMVVVLLAGVYKFNFTNDDIYIKNKKREVIPLNQTKNKD